MVQFGGTRCARALALAGVSCLLAARLGGADSLHFERNDGQTDPRARFLARAPGYTVFVTGTETIVRMVGRDLQGPASDLATIRLKWKGANPASELTGSDLLLGKSHYFVGNDPSHWRRDVPHYGRVHAHDLYPGIDLVLYGNQRALEWDVVVSPGADPGVVRGRVSGARLSLDRAGQLVMEAGAHTLVQEVPAAYQELNGRQQRVEL